MNALRRSLSRIVLSALTLAAPAALHASPTVPDTTDIVYDTVVHGQIDPVGDVDAYRFTGAAGDSVIIRAGGGGNDFQKRVELFDSTGARLASVGGSLGSWGQVDLYASLPGTGRYHILVSAPQGND
ncbi:MAG: PPC domain-containing protein, partial [Candidatus Eisenbacteria bacterium]|nr:PPC domain-containing protein [Candidatus Eisenbacteria bacterium]